MIRAQDNVLIWEGEIDRAVPRSIAGAALKQGWLVAGEEIDVVVSYDVIAEGGTRVGGPGPVCTATARKEAILVAESDYVSNESLKEGFDFTVQI